MTAEEKDEFWAALTRLHASSVKNLEALEKLAAIAETHEKRLDRAEVIVVAMDERMGKFERRIEELLNEAVKALIAAILRTPGNGH